MIAGVQILWWCVCVCVYGQKTYCDIPRRYNLFKIPLRCGFGPDRTICSRTIIKGFANGSGFGRISKCGCDDLAVDGHFFAHQSCKITRFFEYSSTLNHPGSPFTPKNRQCSRTIPEPPNERALVHHIRRIPWSMIGSSGWAT